MLRRLLQMRGEEDDGDWCERSRGGGTPSLSLLALRTHSAHGARIRRARRAQRTCGDGARGVRDTMDP